MSSQQPIQRVHLLDELRGFAVFSMILYHALYDMAYLFPLSLMSTLLHHPVILYLQPLFGGLFVIISGIASQYSRNNLKRGLQCFLCGMALTFVTGIIIPEQIVRFGILHMLGISMILVGLFKHKLDKLNPKLLFVICFMLFILTKNITQGFIGLPNWGIGFSLPQAWYQSSLTFLLFPLGIFDITFFSSDYYPLFPWLFLFLIGGCIGVPLKKNQFPCWVYSLHSRFLSWVGRHSLLLYLIHQPVLYGLLFGVQQLTASYPSP